MNAACVIGNGPSRKLLDLYDIHRCMTTYGCNALYRDFIPHYLISMDIFMVREILGNNIHYKTKFYTQHTNHIDDMARDGHPINFVWGQRETLDSGNTALRIALKNNHDIVYMIGFDYMVDNDIPNIYTDSPNYYKSNQYPAPESQNTRWRGRLSSILKEFNKIKVVRVTTNPINLKHDNFLEITINEFKEELYGIYA